MKTQSEWFLRFKKYLSKKVKVKKKLKYYGIYYINGAEVLPPPLSKERELEIIRSMPYDKNARKLLIEHNLRLVAHIVKKYTVWHK